MVSSHVVVLSDYLSGLLFWKENLCLCREMWKSFAHGDNLDFSLFECHCLRQFGLYGYFMWILDFARFMKLTSEESPPFTTDIDVIVFYLWYLRNVLIEWHIWILFSSWWFLYKWLGGGTNQLKKEEDLSTRIDELDEVIKWLKLWLRQEILLRTIISLCSLILSCLVLSCLK